MEDKTEKTETTALVVRDEQRALLRPIAPAGALIEQHKQVAEIIAKALERGVDYGPIPGGGKDAKDALLKAGAERLSIAFGLYPRYSIVEREVDHDRKVEWTKRKKRWQAGQFNGWDEEVGVSVGFYRYLVRCELVLRSDGGVMGDGLGSCSTMESKYIDRPRDMENTVIKMAEKRAMVGAVLNTLGLSDRFTQDIEDQDHDAPPAARGKSKPPAQLALASEKQVARLKEMLADPNINEAKRDAIAGALADERLTAGRAGALIGDARKGGADARDDLPPGM